jgi:S-adenosylmethionine hydrolase
MKAIITLTTDFGLHDSYVAAMKGVILSINPEASIVDICHQIEPQDITQAAFVINSTWKYFPKDAIHIVVVDPGVGSQRRAVILRNPNAYFVAPDNGVLSYIIEDAIIEKDAMTSGIEQGFSLKRLPPGLEAFSIVNPEFQRHPVSRTFHGRDIFAPAAAHLSLGTPQQDFGESVDSLITFAVPLPLPGDSGELIGHIIYTDNFGNLVTDIKEEHIPSGNFNIEVGGQQIEGLSTSYIEGGDLLALIGSCGYLEISRKNGSAADFIGSRTGDLVMVKSRI